MNFKYELSGVGWADGFIEINSSVAYFTTSYLTNALKDLLGSLLSLIPECVPFPLKSTTFEWHEEPGGTVWSFEKKNSKEVLIRIVSYENMFPKKEIGIDINEVCPIDDLVIVIVNELEVLLKKHGVDGYKEKWVNHEFPSAEYQSLISYLTQNHRKFTS
jgi:hypothetical protein